MTTSTPPAWSFLEEKYVPVEIDPGYYPADVDEMCPSFTEVKLSIHSHKLPVSDALRERSDSDDPTGEDVWPLERECDCTAQVTDSVINAVPEHWYREHPWVRDGAGVQSVREKHTKLPVGARNEHPDRTVSQTGNAPDTGNVSWVCSNCGQERYGSPAGISTWHVDICDICGERKMVTEPRDFGDHHDDDSTCTVTAPETTAPAGSCVEKCPVCLHEMDDGEAIYCDYCEEFIGPGSFAVVNGPGGVFVYHLRCYDEVYWGTIE